MSRSRNIKPGFFTNDVLCSLPPLARILFAGLWTEADRSGRLEDRPARLKMQLLGYDQCDAEPLLAALHKHGFILRYESGGNRYIQVIAWEKHQNPHVKERESTIPAPCKHETSPVQAPEIPERAGLIPDSGFLILDSSDVPKEHKARSRKSASRATLSVADLIADGVEEDHARDWLKARGKVPLTQTAWDAVKREAERAHIPNSQAVRIAAENGWRGFKAEWANNGHNGSKPSKPAWLADREARMAEFTGQSKEIIDAAARRLD